MCTVRPSKGLARHNGNNNNSKHTGGQTDRQQLLQRRIANVICVVVVIVVEFVADCASAVRDSEVPSCQKPRQSQAVTTTATVSAKAVKQVVPRQAWRPKTSGGTFNLCARKSGRHELLFKKEYTNYI